jgi:biopolymer transport protein ExbD
MPIKKKKKDPPAITTASLPDIVFMLLCFFMVVTKMRDAEVKVRTVVPTASELQKLEDKSLVNHIYIGEPAQQFVAQFGTAPRIQLDDQFATPQDIARWVASRRSKTTPALHNKMIAALKVDGDVKMGIITEVKTELRKQNLRKVSYIAGKRAKSN